MCTLCPLPKLVSLNRARKSKHKGKPYSVNPKTKGGVGFLKVVFFLKSILQFTM